MCRFIDAIVTILYGCSRFGVDSSLSCSFPFPFPFPVLPASQFGNGNGNGNVYGILERREVTRPRPGYLHRNL